MIKHTVKNRGFMFLDLIIIISLISLAYFVYNHAIEKDIDREANAIKTQIVVNYIEALEAFNIKNGTYPEYGLFNEQEKKLSCLGRASAGTKCMHEAWIHDEFLTLDIEEFYPEVPKVVFPEIADGIAYGCDRETIGDACDRYIIEWFVDGSVSCDLGKYEPKTGQFDIELQSEDVTFCRFISS